MGLTTALNTSLNGLSLNETLIEVIGNNIANAGTNGFKASNVQFTTQLARTISVGSAPQGFNGGTNPKQVGLGATTAAIRRDNSQGAITGSTSPSDLAIEGEGYFTLQGPAGQVFSRNGNFTLNQQSRLVNADGLRVQGYGIDDQYNITNTQLTDIVLPLGTLTVAQQTSLVRIEGAVKSGAAAEVATQRGIIQTAVLTDTTTGVGITGASLLSDVELNGTPLFTVGETINYTPRKGGARLTEESFAIEATSTMDDLATFFSDVLGLIDDGSGGSPDLGTQAGAIITSDGRLRIVSNIGTSQEVDLPGSLLSQTNLDIENQLDLGFTEFQEANGESAVVTFPVYDSLGEQLIVRMHAVLETKTTSATTYRYFLESQDDSDRSTALSTGTFSLNSIGEPIDSRLGRFTLNRADTAASDLDVEVDFTGISGLTEFNSSSTLNLSSQDGAPPGTLSDFNINESGIINGVFSNGVIRPLGQIVLARFANPLGLVENGGGTYIEGVSSGPAQIVEAGEQGSGTLRAGAVELSNTDVGRSLVDLIVASTNYRGNARVISSTQQLVDELLVLGR